MSCESFVKQDEVDKKRAFLASLLEGDDEEGSGLRVPPVPMRKTTAKGKVPLYGAEKAANGIASREVRTPCTLTDPHPAQRLLRRVVGAGGISAQLPLEHTACPSPPSLRLGIQCLRARRGALLVLAYLSLFV